MLRELNGHACSSECRADLLHNAVILALVAVHIVDYKKRGLAKFLDEAITVDQAYINTA